MKPTRKAPRLYFTLDQALHRLGKSVDRQCLARTGVSSAQLSALYFIRDHESCAQGDIAAAFGHDESAATGMLTRLERAGLVARERDPNDRRVSRVRLTSSGREVLTTADTLIDTLTRRLAAGFDEHELSVVQRFLDSVIRRVEAGEL